MIKEMQIVLKFKPLAVIGKNGVDVLGTLDKEKLLEIEDMTRFKALRKASSFKKLYKNELVYSFEIELNGLRHFVHYSFSIEYPEVS